MSWYIKAGGGYENPWKGEHAEKLRQGCEYCDPHHDSLEGVHEPDCVTFLSDDPKQWRKDHKAVSPRHRVEHDFHKRMNGRGWYL